MVVVSDGACVMLLDGAGSEGVSVLLLGEVAAELDDDGAADDDVSVGAAVEDDAVSVGVGAAGVVGVTGVAPGGTGAAGALGWAGSIVVVLGEGAAVDDDGDVLDGAPLVLDEAESVGVGVTGTPPGGTGAGGADDDGAADGASLVLVLLDADDEDVLDGAVSVLDGELSDGAGATLVLDEDGCEGAAVEVVDVGVAGTGTPPGGTGAGGADDDGAVDVGAADVGDDGAAVEDGDVLVLDGAALLELLGDDGAGAALVLLDDEGAWLSVGVGVPVVGLGVTGTPPGGTGAGGADDEGAGRGAVFDGSGFSVFEGAELDDGAALVELADGAADDDVLVLLGDGTCVWVGLWGTGTPPGGTGAAGGVLDDDGAGLGASVDDGDDGA